MNFIYKQNQENFMTLADSDLTGQKASYPILAAFEEKITLFQFSDSGEVSSLMLDFMTFF